VITFPFVLLLLDYWRWAAWGRKVRANKACCPTKPVALGAGETPTVCPCGHFLWATLWGVGRALENVPGLSWSWRIQNALISYASYLCQSFYPVRLAVFYPRRPLDLPLTQVVGSAALLLIITRIAWVWRGGVRTFCRLAVVFGNVGPHDRLCAVRRSIGGRPLYVLPQIGLAIALAWGAADLLLVLALP